MKYEKLDIENFKCFVGKHSFDFMKGVSGLYFVQGENLDEPSLGPNGAGKSTLIDAIVWCLYGSTVRGLKGKHVKSWGKGNSCSVRLEYTKDNKPHNIYRTWHPNTLMFDGVEVVQEELQKHLGLSKTTFLSSVVVGQFNQHFFDLQPASKTALLTEVLDLEYWDKLSIEAADQRDYLYSLKDASESTICRYAENIKTHSKTLEGLNKKRSEFGARRDKEIEEVTKHQKTIALDMKRAEKDLKKCKVKVTIATKNFAVLQTELSDQRDASAIYHRDCSGKKDELADLALARDDIADDLLDFQELKGRCPECFQDIAKEHCQKHVVRLTEELKTQTEIVKAAAIQFDKDSNKKDFLKERTDEIILHLTEIEDELSDLVQSVHDDEVVIEVAKNEQVGGKIRLAALQNQENPFISLIEDTQNLLDGAYDNEERCEQELKEIIKEATSVSFWRKGFKSVRLLMIDSILRQLEIEINNSLIDLGLLGWEVFLSVEKENLTGGISKGTYVNIKSPSQKDPVPWESWSGGESQRLRIAGTMAMSNLILDSTSVKPNVMFWDEPSNHLGGSGLDDLVSYLSDKASADSADRQIYLIDHRLLSESSAFVGKVLITKKNKRSVINVTA